MKWLNSFSINMLKEDTHVSFEKMTWEHAVCCAMSTVDPPESHIGHSDLASLVSAHILTEIPACRDTVTLEPGEQAVVAQYRGPRLPEGTTELPEGAKIEYWLISLAPTEVPASGPEGEWELAWDDEQCYSGTGGGSCRHTPKLALHKDGQTKIFRGSSIPGFVRVLADEFHKNGKWSYQSWRLRLGTGVQAWTQRGGRIRRLGLEPKDPGRDYHAATSWDDLEDVPGSVLEILLPQQHQDRLEANSQPV